MRKLPALVATLLSVMAAFAVAQGCGKKAESTGDQATVEGAEGAESATPKKVKKDKEGDEASAEPAEGDAPKTRHSLRDRVGKRPGPVHPKGPGDEPGEGPAKDPTGDPATPTGTAPKADPPKTDPGAPPVVADTPKTDPGTPPVVADAPKTDPGTPPAGEPAVPGTPTPTPPTPPTAPAPPTPIGDAPKEGGVGGTAPKPELRNAAGGIDAAVILPLATVLEVTAAKGLENQGILPGIALALGYGSTFYAAPGGAHFGVALQVWQDVSRRESDDRFRRMRLQYPNAEDIAVLQPLRAYYSYFQGIQSLVFADPSRRMIIAIGCGESVCNQEQLVKLAKAARDRL